MPRTVLSPPTETQFHSQDLCQRSRVIFHRHSFVAPLRHPAHPADPRRYCTRLRYGAAMCSLRRPPGQPAYPFSIQLRPHSDHCILCVASQRPFFCTPSRLCHQRRKPSLWQRPCSRRHGLPFFSYFLRGTSFPSSAARLLRAVLVGCESSSVHRAQRDSAGPRNRTPRRLTRKRKAVEYRISRVAFRCPVSIVRLRVVPGRPLEFQ